MTLLVFTNVSCVTCVACLIACSGAVDVEAGSESYAQRSRAVAGIIERSCAKQTCHGELSANAHLDFMRLDFRAALVSVPACEYSRMARVEPGDPDRSWIMIKLAGPARFRGFADFIELTPEPGWQPGLPECSGMFEDGAPWFGTRMPPPDTTIIAPDEVETIRAWIAEGAT